MGKPLELSIEKENEDAEDRSKKTSIRLIRVGDGIIEVARPWYDVNLTVKRWFQQRNHEKRRSPLVAGLSFFRGSENPNPCSTTHYRSSNVISGIALCLGGSHCLFIDNTYEHYRISAAIALRDFLGDPRVTVVGVGMQKAAESLKKDWNIVLGKPVEVRTLMEAAYQKQEMPRKATLEDMAEIALDGMRTRRRAAHRQREKGYGCLDEAQALETTFNSFLCFKIGVKCLQKLGRPA
ncbi:Ribonuclease H-like protein [Dioscorea alata]|uniref:Ribonuclease H-like protein n=1 Tax=Dioscorea alata TaxID=55571 RepID=A0ACB7WFG2_DIOAL|nr:Ribonuclease H-like protein [Dioscorea alata]